MPTRASDLLLLACPSCRGELADMAGGLECNVCGLSFGVRDGIVDLRQHRKDYYFNPVKQERMRDLVANVRQRPWRETVRRFMREVNGNPDWLDNLIVDGRYAWRLLLELPKDGVALDIGCGLGNLARNLAPNVGHMIGMDLTMERLEFARERFALFNRDDKMTLVAAGDGRYLPFRDSTFDLVTLSGVLEWIPDDERAWEGGVSKIGKAARMVWSHFGKSNPRRVQIEFLREINRILKPRGQLFVAIENRLGYEYFLGMPDHHSGLKFNSLLPRLAANLYSIARARKPYRTYTYSIPGFKRLFGRAGYAKAEFYGLTPGYTHLSEITPAWATNAIWAPQKGRAMASRIKESAIFVPAYGIVVSKSGDTLGSAMINRLGARMEREAGEGPGTFRITRWRITGKDKAVLDARLGERDIIVRIPLNSLADEAEARNWDVISAARRDAQVASLTPAPIIHGVEQGLSFYVESKIPGVTLTEVIVGGEDVGAFLLEASSLAQKYNPGSASRGATKLEGADYENLVQKPLDRVAEISGMLPASAKISDLLRQSLYGATIKLGLSHGDLTADNIFVDRKRITGVIDWEESRARGMPLLDVIAYLESVCRVRTPGLTVAETFASLAGGLELLVPAEIAALEDAFDKFGTSLRCRREIAMLAWIYHCDALLRTQVAFDTNTIERRVAGLFSPCPG